MPLSEANKATAEMVGHRLPKTLASCPWSGRNAVLQECFVTQKLTCAYAAGERIPRQEESIEESDIHFACVEVVGNGWQSRGGGWRLDGRQ